MNDWTWINMEVSIKISDDKFHIRKLNLKTAKYSYMILKHADFNAIEDEIIKYESRNGILTKRTQALFQKEEHHNG